MAFVAERRRVGNATLAIETAVQIKRTWRRSMDEARSLAAMLRQSIELGTDVGDALRAFSDDMRDRRLLRAEERANQLPVKMVGPLGLFIFRVILGIAMLPVIIRLITVLQ